MARARVQRTQLVGIRPAWRDVAALLAHPDCQGAGAIQLVGANDFYQESALPFQLEGGGAVCHLIPRDGFRKESLAGSADERLLIVDCPDAEGWLVPEDILRDWMARNVVCERLDDLLLAHPLYEYLTHPDEDGFSRGGRSPLVQWAPGFPSLASICPPEFLPDDDEAPAVNRDRSSYAAAVVGLLSELEANFDLLELELGLRFGPARPPRGAHRPGRFTGAGAS